MSGLNDTYLILLDISLVENVKEDKMVTESKILIWVNKMNEN